MPRKINVITNNSYFFVGVAAQLCADDRVINQMSLEELKQHPADNFNQRDALIFHMTKFTDEIALLISMLTFPGDVVLVPAEAKATFDLDFEQRRVLAARSDNGTASLENPASAVHFMQFKLTRREKAIMLHTINGLTAQDIGQLLVISTKTVYTHRRNALRKLGGRNLFQVCAIKETTLTSAIG